MKWMNLEPGTQSGVSQKEKSKYHPLTHIYGLQKDDIDNPTCRGAKETCKEKAFELNGKKRGWDDLREQH